MINLSIENGIATITLNRPEKLNAFSGTMREDLLRALRQVVSSSSCTVSNSAATPTRLGNCSMPPEAS